MLSLPQEPPPAPLAPVVLGGSSSFSFQFAMDNRWSLPICLGLLILAMYTNLTSLSLPFPAFRHCVLLFFRSNSSFPFCTSSDRPSDSHPGAGARRAHPQEKNSFTPLNMKK